MNEGKPGSVSGNVEAALEEAVAHPGRARDFVLFSLGQFVSSVGTWMQKTAIGWLSWELTHSPAWVGAIAMTDFIAALWVAPLAGTVTDRSNVYRLLGLAQIALLLSALLLCVVDLGGWMTIELLLVFTLLNSTFEGFANPARMVAMNLLSGPARISQAIATGAIAISLGRSIGPAIAGLMIVTLGEGAVFGANAASYLAMLAAIGWLRTPLSKRVARPHAPFRAEIVQGFRYVAHERQVATIFVIAASFSLLARPALELLPAFAGAVFNGGPATLAMLVSAQGLGALIGSFWMLRARGDPQLARLAVRAGTALAVLIVAFGASANPLIAVPLLTAAGTAHVLCNISLQSLAQLRAAPEMRGRVLSIYSLLFRSGPALGAFALGFVAEHVRLGNAVGICAFAAGFIILLTRLRTGPILHAQQALSPASLDAAHR